MKDLNVILKESLGKWTCPITKKVFDSTDTKAIEDHCNLLLEEKAKKDKKEQEKKDFQKKEKKLLDAFRNIDSMRSCREWVQAVFSLHGIKRNFELIVPRKPQGLDRLSRYGLIYVQTKANLSNKLMPFMSYISSSGHQLYIHIPKTSDFGKKVFEFNLSSNTSKLSNEAELKLREDETYNSTVELKKIKMKEIHELRAHVRSLDLQISKMREDFKAKDLFID